MQPDLQIEAVALSLLVPYATNARTHSDEQIKQIAKSITQFGFINPVLIDATGILIAGHGRVMAANLLGLEFAPAIRLGHLTDVQARSFRLADNQIALNASWDIRLLRAELQGLTELGVNVELLGFSDGELSTLLMGHGRGQTDPDEVPETPTVAVTREGDGWICGEHRIQCGDATLPAAVETLMAGDVANMTFTDPPYNVNYRNNRTDKQRGNARPILNDALAGQFEAFLLRASINILAVTEGAVYICMSSSELDTLQRAFREAGGRWSTFLIWAKSSFTLGRSDYQRQFEPILYGWRDGIHHYWSGARNQGDVLFFDKPHRNDLHPTMKPVALVERTIGNSSKAGDIVLDPFAGSGTTLIAATRTGRRARLMELDPRYVDVAVERWQRFTGREATLAADGRTFGAVSEERQREQT